MTAGVHDQTGFAARFEWGVEGVAQLAPTSDVVLVVDVLTFCTAVDVAVGTGVRVFPWRWKDGDESLGEFVRETGARVSGKWGDELSLSPSTLRKLAPGQSVVLRSPNGAACILEAAARCGTVLAGCLRNAGAVAAFAKAAGGTVSVIGAGERWPSGELRPSYEDLVGAGAILSQFPRDWLSPEARTAVGAFRSMADDLLASLADCASGRELVAAGFADDVAVAATLNESQNPLVLREGAF